MTVTGIIRDEVVEKISKARTEREEMKSFMRVASDDLGGLFFGA